MPRLEAERRGIPDAVALEKRPTKAKPKEWYKTKKGEAKPPPENRDESMITEWVCVGDQGHTRLPASPKKTSTCVYTMGTGPSHLTSVVCVLRSVTNRRK